MKDLQEERIMTRSCPLLAIAVVVMASLPAGGHAASWSCLGPQGAAIREAIVVGADGQYVYAASDEALWKSTDAGAHFARVGLPVTRIVSIAAVPDQPQTVWVLAEGWSGTAPDFTVTVSDDAGASWHQVRSFKGGAGGVDPSGLIIDPLRPGAVDFAENTEPFAVERLSQDGTVTQLAPVDGPVVALTAAHDGVLYVATFSQGFFRRNEPCGRWFKLRNPGVASPLALAVNPEDAAVVLAGSFDGLKISTDRGVSWQTTGVSGWVTSAAFNRADPTVAWCTTTHQLWISTDGGRSWHATGMRGGLLDQAVPTPADRAGLFVALGAPPEGGDHAGLVASGDFGATFAAADAGITGARVSDLQVGTVSHLAGTAWGGVVTLDRSAGAGRWTFSEPHGWNRVDTIGGDPAGERLFAATYVDEGAGYGDALFASDDGGSTWAGRVGTVPRVVFSSLKPDPSDPNRLFAAGNRGVGFFDLARGSWIATGSEGAPVETVLPLAAFPGVVLAAGGAAGLLRSTDDGATWQRVAAIGAGAGGAWQLDASKAGPVYLLAGEHGLFESDDGGSTWHSRTVPAGGACTGLAVSPRSSDEIYVACPSPAGEGTGPGLWRSLDGGVHWLAMSGPRDVRAISVRVDPDQPDLLFVATQSHAVWSIRLAPGPRRVRGRVGRHVMRVQLKGNLRRLP